MPGGRNKSIGPVTLNEGEIERVLNGVEFEHERRKFKYYRSTHIWSEEEILKLKFNLKMLTHWWAYVGSP